MLIYVIIFMDFIRITITSPGMCFLVDPQHPGFFHDFPCTLALALALALNASAAPALNASASEAVRVVIVARQEHELMARQ